MSVVDLSKRVTVDWNQYNKYRKSSESLIYIEGEVIRDAESGPATIEITLGDKFFDIHKNIDYQVNEKGLKIKPGESVLFVSEQRIAMPLNVFGMVFGKGKNIFKGGFISSGKINPGFDGHLKIGYFNGSMSTIVFKKGDVIACCCFMDMETYLDNPLPIYATQNEPHFVDQNLFMRCLRWLGANWFAVVSTALSVIAILISLFKM